MQQELSQAYAFRDNLLNEGVIKQDRMGTIHTVNDPRERKSLKKEISSKSKLEANQSNTSQGD